MGNLIENDLIESIKNTRSTLLKCMMIVTPTELCGSFLTGKIGKNTTKDNFLAFWKSEYMPEKYLKLSDLFYRILRNGVSHSFVSKGGIIPSSDETALDKHLWFLKEGVFIYVPKLGEDVINGISMLLEDIKKDKNNLKKNYESVLSKLKKKR